MKKTVQKAYAKINLYLDVVGKRDDGYHNINSVMQTVSLSDTVTIETIESGEIILADNIGVEKEKNLCFKAAMLFFEELKKSFGVRITLEKRIPMTAGLGGGSADAAAVLRGLNELSGDFFSVSELKRIALKLGADVPFCVCGGTATATGVGECLKDAVPLPNCFFTIADISGKLSTAEAYRRLDSVCDAADKPPFDVFLKSLEAKDIDLICKNMYNGFEQLYTSELTKAKSIFKSSGAIRAMMSGSGLATFGVYKTKEFAEIAARCLSSEEIISYAAEPVGKYY